jgi:phenylacetate-CoA ligase
LRVNCGWIRFVDVKTVAASPVSRLLSPELNPLQIRSRLGDGLAETVEYVRAKSPFYRRKFAGTAPLKSMEGFQALPLTTKTEVSQCNDQFWCVDQGRFVDICTTSGTTGIPTLYPLTARDLDRLGENECLSFGQTGLAAGDVVVLAVTIDKCFMAGLAYFEGLKKLGATAIRVGAGSPAMLLSMIDRLQPSAIVSVPSFIKRVAAYAVAQGIDPARSTVRKLICIGEPVRDSAWNLTALGSHIADAWNANVFSTYGITELACSLCECPAGQGGHLHPKLLHIEIVDDAGNPVADGVTGQLVATSIGVEAMPLVRFVTGDLTFMTHERCACGRSTPRIGPILGRRDQAMKIKGTMVYPATVQRTLQSVEQVVDYVMIATAPTPLSDELEVVVAVRGDAGEAEELIREKLRGDLRVSPVVRISTAAEIAALGHSNELRKQRVFIDRRKAT